MNLPATHKALITVKVGENCRLFSAKLLLVVLNYIHIAFPPVVVEVPFF